jgi:hypothetical protein
VHGTLDERRLMERSWRRRGEEGRNDAARAVPAASRGITRQMQQTTCLYPVPIDRFFLSSSSSLVLEKVQQGRFGGSVITYRSAIRALVCGT